MAEVTAPTSDVAAWLFENHPFATVKHSAECDRVSVGDNCIGGCEIEPEKMYIVCRQCGESFDDLVIANNHTNEADMTCGSYQGFDIMPESAAF